MSNILFKRNTLMVLSVSLLGLAACGGGGSGSGFVKPKVVDGVFKDSNVSGLSFVSGDEKGVTDEKGAFTYEEGKVATFSIGGVKLGSGKGKAVMTPIDLVAAGSLKSPEVINKVRFLMMLDQDNKPGNGIVISQKVQEKAKSWKTVDFRKNIFPAADVYQMVTDASVEDAVSHSLPTNDVAAKHLKTTLLCANAGAFAGSYAGSESGNIALMVDPVSGEVKGSSYNPTNKVSVDIKSTAKLDYDKGLDFISAEDSAKQFIGKLKSTEELSGTWLNLSVNSQKGSFSGQRVGGESDAVYRYTASFTGSDKGLFTFDVDKNNKLEGVIYNVSTKQEIKMAGQIKKNELAATSDEGDKLTAFIDDKTLEFTTGVWINGEKKTGGTFKGSGCRLN